MKKISTNNTVKYSILMHSFVMQNNKHRKHSDIFRKSKIIICNNETTEAKERTSTKKYKKLVLE